MELEFRSATEGELETVFAIYREAIREMGQRGIEQWDEIYPDREVLAEDIRKRELFTGRAGGEIVLAYALNRECDEGYVNGKWSFPESSCLILHRLCLSPSVWGRGIGGMALAHIEEEVRRIGKRSIRLDAFSENPAALRMYEKRGYQNVGDLFLRKGRFFLMEKGVTG